MKVILLPKAIGRLDEIYDFIKVKNENVAINIFNSILDEIKILEDFPQVAAAEPLLEGYGKTFRSLVVMKNYKVVYYIEEDVVYITTIWDCRQNPMELKKEFTYKIK